MLKQFAAIGLIIGSLAAPIAASAQTSPDQKHQCISTIKSHYRTAWRKLEPKRQTAARLSLLAIGSDRPGSRQFAKQLTAEIKQEESKIIKRFESGGKRCNRLAFSPPPGSPAPEYSDGSATR